ncbi:MAG: hypothetical protein Q8N61_00645 [bacterium]|nr:hypothetical protein [bacterium]
MKKEKVIPILFDTYIAFIKNSMGSKIFRNFYAEVNGKRTDILKNGILSCACFVSSLLYLFKLIKDAHATVEGTIRDLQQSGWKSAKGGSASGGKKPKIGSIIVWEKNHNSHKHIGFYVGNNKAISTSSKNGQPVIHHWTYGVKKNRPVRKVEAIFWNKKLQP